MGWERWSRRAVGNVAWVTLQATLMAQHEPHATPPHSPSPSAAEQKRGSPTPATHAPLPTLHPLLAWEHVKRGNAAAVQARAAQQPLPAPAERPAGAGRYLCAVLLCADADVDIASLLGLPRQDVLLLSVPGPFATPETTDLLERTVADERLSLVLVVTHADCRSLAERAKPDALSRRLAALRAEAARRQQPLPKTLAQLQRDQLLAASTFLRERSERVELRILPATLDGKTGALAWHHTQAEVMPLAPVK